MLSMKIMETSQRKLKGKIQKLQRQKTCFCIIIIITYFKFVWLLKIKAVTRVETDFCRIRKWENNRLFMHKLPTSINFKISIYNLSLF